MRMELVRKSFISVMALSLSVAVMLAPMEALRADPPVSSEQVVNAIHRGVAYLLAHENPKTCWETGLKIGGVRPAPKAKAKPNTLDQYGGETALVTEALLDVGQSLKMPELNIFHPAMQNALKFLTKLRPLTTYSASFQANCMTLLPRKARYMDALRYDARYLLLTMHSNGAYYYALEPFLGPNPVIPGEWDNSNTQYGVLGMWAVAHAGMEVPTRYWRIASLHWRKTQYPNGAWNYMQWGFPNGPFPKRGPNDPPNNYKRWQPFTPAGVASLFICDEYLFASPRLHAVADPNILRGLNYIAAHFDPNTPNLYAMYGIERVGLASGLKTFGSNDWYLDFANTLVHNQLGDGSWGGNLGFLGLDNNIGTAYALLILDRGLNPVLINKLWYGNSYYGQWNSRQRDVANFTSWLSTTFEAPLNWQAVSISTPANEWLDSPLLYIAGHKNPKFSKDEIAKIGRFMDDGGLVVANCDGQTQRFKRAMIKLGEAAVNNQYSFKPLDRTSLIYHMQPWYHPQTFGKLLGLWNGVRYLMIISTTDWGAAWQAHRFNERDRWELPANIYFYATGNSSLSDRLHSLAVSPGAGGSVHLDVGQLQYAGNWNPEPAAWQRFSNIASSQYGMSVNLQTIPAGQLQPKHVCPLLHMLGTGKFALTSSQVADLKSYLNAGGMLFGEAAGGDLDFTNSFSALVQQLFPGQHLQDVPAASSLFTGHNPGGADATHVTYRKYFVNQHGIKRTPSLLGIKQNGRWVVIFSQYDITSGLLGTHTWGITGYSPDSSVALARNIVAYAAAHTH